MEEWIKWGTTPGQDTSLVSWVTNVADVFRPDPKLPYLEAKLDPGARRRQLATSTKLTEAEIDRVQVQGCTLSASVRVSLRLLRPCFIACSHFRCVLVWKPMSSSCPANGLVRLALPLAVCTIGHTPFASLHPSTHPCIHHPRIHHACISPCFDATSPAALLL